MWKTKKFFLSPHLWQQRPDGRQISQILLKFAKMWHFYTYKSNFKNAFVPTLKMAVAKCGECWTTLPQYLTQA